MRDSITFTEHRIKCKKDAHKYGISLFCIQFHSFQVTKVFWFNIYKDANMYIFHGPSHQVVIRN